MTYYEQVGIAGIADNKPFNCQNKRCAGRMLRPRLHKYIYDTRGIDQSEFARILDISPATVTQWLYTERMPSGSTLFRMVKAFALSYDDVLKLFSIEQPK